MLSQTQQWLSDPSLNWRNILAVTTIYAFLGILLSSSELGQHWEDRISRPTMFSARQHLGQGLKLDPRIKIYAIDDKTVSWLQASAPDSRTWLRLLEGISKRQPDSIIIDSLMTQTDSTFTKDLLKKAQQNTESVSIITANFHSPQKLSFRQPLPLEGLPRVHEFGENSNTFPWKNLKSPWVYASDPAWRTLFFRTGHINYSGDGHIWPFFRLTDDRVLPQITLSAFSPIVVASNKIKLGQTNLFVDSDGRVPVNFLPYPDLLSATKPLLPLLRKNTQKPAWERIQKGDFVYLMPAFYTGNTDFWWTPVGTIPGGYVHASLLNSILSEKALRPIFSVEFATLGALGAAILTALASHPLTWLIALLGTSSIYTALCLTAFISADIVIPWFTPLVFFLLCSATLQFLMARQQHKRSRFIKQCLDGVIAKDSVEEVAKNPTLLNLTTREHVVTVMFVDVVGFSLVSENILPRIAFDQLKKVLSDVIRIVHAHGGVVNRNLGDGLLCFFGYSFEQDKIVPHHAQVALECSIAIQEANLPKSIQRYDQGLPVFPLRIGLNTASVYLGDIGFENKIDVTIVGNGVNFAKRMEGAASLHSILMGPTTKELIDDDQIDRAGLSGKLVDIKHHNQLVQAWEFDPFSKNPALRRKAIDAHRSMVKKVRSEERWGINKVGEINLKTSVGEGKLLNFSKHGLSVHLDIQIMVGASLKIAFDSNDGLLAEELASVGHDIVFTTVCWSVPSEHGFTYGLQYKTAEEEDLERIFSVLKKSAA